MSDAKMVVKFPFVVNKSFSGSGRPITIPARFYPALKDSGISDLVRVRIKFREDLVIDGAIRAGFRAGGKYYQLTMVKSAESEGIVVAMGSTLGVCLFRDADGWFVEIS